MSGADLPIVLLHALPLDSSMWDEPARALRACGHRVLPIDQCGFGRTPLPVDAAPSLDLLADELARELDRRGLDSAVVAGCSMGGYAAMSFLRRHPHRVRALGLFASRGTADTPEGAAARLRFADLISDDSLRARIVADTTSSLLGATTRAQQPGLLARVTALAQAADPQSVAWAQRAIAAREASLSALSTADVPAVVVQGEEDELVTVDEARATAAALAGGRLVTLPGVGHLAPLEAPGKTAEILVWLLAAGHTSCPDGAKAC
ncbi:alpha/beta hydrolase [Saccharopolyspora sp. ID03-671]|uniref:alpha/beta fold hydrolase n=1 Tax=Saccharopolyspora sp. ID03-671 TaxID=3073066 RepID=UPI00324BFD15